jgi:hypothetical protein
MNRKVWFRLLPSTLSLWADECLDTPSLDSLKIGNKFEIQLDAYPASNLIKRGNELKFQHLNDNKYNICGIIRDFHEDKFLLDCGFPIRLRLSLYEDLEQFEYGFYEKKIIEQNRYMRKNKIEVDESIINEFISGDICLQGDFPLGSFDGLWIIQKVGGKITSIKECIEATGEMGQRVYKPSTIEYKQFKDMQQYTPSLSS